MNYHGQRVLRRNLHLKDPHAEHHGSMSNVIGADGQQSLENIIVNAEEKA